MNSGQTDQSLEKFTEIIKVKITVITASWLTIQLCWKMKILRGGQEANTCPRCPHQASGGKEVPYFSILGRLQATIGCKRHFAKCWNLLDELRTTATKYAICQIPPTPPPTPEPMLITLCDTIWSFCVWPTLCRGGCFTWGWDVKKFGKNGMWSQLGNEKLKMPFKYCVFPSKTPMSV